MFAELTRDEVPRVSEAPGGRARRGDGMTRTAATRATASEPLVFGVVGLGYWGPNLLRVLAEMPLRRGEVDLRPRRAAARAIRPALPGRARTTEVDALLDDPELDAIVIATPVFTHFDLASRSLERRQAHLRREAARPLHGAGRRAAARSPSSQDLVLMCGHTFLYSPPVRAVKDLLDDDELGDVFFVSSSRVNLGLHQPDVSVIWDLGPHDFSILLYWLGEVPRTVRAVGRDSIVPGIPDVAFVTLTYESGIVANVELSWLAPSKLRRTVVVGSEKMVVYDDGTAEPVRVFDHGVVYKDPETFGEYQLSYRTGDILSPKIDDVRAARRGARRLRERDPLRPGADASPSWPGRGASSPRPPTSRFGAAGRRSRSAERAFSGRVGTRVAGAEAELTGGVSSSTGRPRSLLPRAPRAMTARSERVDGQRCGDRGRRDVGTRAGFWRWPTSRRSARHRDRELVVSRAAAAELLLGLVTLSRLDRVFKVYGLYDRDSKRISHSTSTTCPRSVPRAGVGSWGCGPTRSCVFPAPAPAGPGASLFGVVAARDPCRPGGRPARCLTPASSASGRSWSAKGRAEVRRCGRCEPTPSSAWSRSAGLRTRRARVRSRAAADARRHRRSGARIGLGALRDRPCRGRRRRLRRGGAARPAAATAGSSRSR